MASSLKVELTSKEMIKPSSPTPHHLKTHQLSFLDQMAPPVHISISLFYPNRSNNTQKTTSTLLKKSLSNTLVHFYPLAGRLQGNKSINCNDEGVEYIETHVSNNLLQVLEYPKLDYLKGLVPFKPTDHVRNDIVLGIQVNFFSCGGIAIGVCLSHKIADGIAFFQFVNAWATMARDEVVVAWPKFDSSSYFPPMDLSGIIPMEVGLRQDKIVARRFVFNKKMLKELKRQVVGKINMNSWQGQIQKFDNGSAHDVPSQVIKPPTSIEVVSTFIWKGIMEAARAKLGPDKVLPALHVVDLRNRMVPRIPKESFGNYWWFTMTPSVIGSDFKDPELVEKVRESIGKIDNDFIRRLQNGGILLELKKAFENSTHQVPESCNFTSGSRFSAYEVDFGWGKPIWVVPPIWPSMYLVFLSTTNCGEGIEGWVSMLEEDFAWLEREHKLLSVSPRL